MALRKQRGYPHPGACCACAKDRERQLDTMRQAEANDIRVTEQLYRDIDALELRSRTLADAALSLLRCAERLARLPGLERAVVTVPGIAAEVEEVRVARAKVRAALEAAGVDPARIVGGSS
jgi:hypothetical protein